MHSPSARILAGGDLLQKCHLSTVRRRLLGSVARRREEEAEGIRTTGLRRHSAGITACIQAGGGMEGVNLLISMSWVLPDIWGAGGGAQRTI